MENTKKVLNCREGRRCSRPLSCRFCGEGWQKGNFKGFDQCFKTLQELQGDEVFFITIGTKKIGDLDIKLNDTFKFIEEVKELKKRGKLGVFFGRLEVSFDKLGFYPHFHFLVWGDYSTFKNVSAKLNFKFHKQKAKNIKNSAWYMLKFNSIGIEKGEAVRKALSKKRTIIRSKEFNFQTISYTDEYICIDFSFMGVYPIRGKEEILLREERRISTKEWNAKIKASQKAFIPASQ